MNEEKLQKVKIKDRNIIEEKFLRISYTQLYLLYKFPIHFILVLNASLRSTASLYKDTIF